VIVGVYIYTPLTRGLTLVYENGRNEKGVGKMEKTG
jgi:hypothetical protein